MSETPRVSADLPDSAGAEALAGLIGGGIAVACWIPPLLHFITGPLGPFLGGWVAGARVRRGARAVLVIGVGVGLGLALTVLLAAALIGVVSAPAADGSPNLQMEWLRGLLEGPAFWAVLGGLTVYGFLLGALGAWVAGAMQEHHRAPSGTPALP